MSARSKHRRRGLWLRRAGLVLAPVVLGLLVLEVLLRTGTVHNLAQERQRLRGDPDGRHRLLILGDSFLLPGGLSQQVADALAADGFAVRSIAVSGTGPLEYLAGFRQVAPSFRPDVVLLGYYVGNDLTDYQNHPSRRDREGARPAVGIDHWTTGSWWSRWYSFPWLVARLRVLLGSEFDEQEMRDSGVEPELVRLAMAGEVNRFLVRQGQLDPGNVLDNLLLERPANRRAWEGIRGLLTELDEECRAREARLVLVVFPHTAQVSSSHVPFLTRLGFQLDERMQQESRPQELLREWATERGVPCLDLLPEFRARGQDAALYRPNDIHLDARGNQLAAERIAACLRSQADD